MAKSRDQLYDELLVLRCQEGDREAFDELVARWQRRLWRQAHRWLEDVATFPRWAFRIVNNKCADWIRKEQRRRGLSESASAGNRNTQVQAAGRSGRSGSLKEALERLPADRRALLSLRYVEGFDVGELADILGIPEGTVKSRLYHARAQLRQLMEEG
ncbi:MAG: RNA polymerase sigma factor [Planctomycetota bacterium]|jgi:RNA polymerase sigma-70 factor (ECF subfamily)